MNTLTTTAAFPILASAGELHHISDDGQRTRCGRDCSQWSHGVGRPERYVKQCPRCGDEAAYSAVNDLLAEREAEREAQRQEANRKSVARHRAISAKRRDLAKVISDMLAESGFDMEIEMQANGENTFVFTSTEFEQVAYQVRVTEATEAASRVRVKRNGDALR